MEYNNLWSDFMGDSISLLQKGTVARSFFRVLQSSSFHNSCCFSCHISFCFCSRLEAPTLSFGFRMFTNSSSPMPTILRNVAMQTYGCTIGRMPLQHFLNNFLPQSSTPPKAIPCSYIPSLKCKPFVCTPHPLSLISLTLC